MERLLSAEKRTEALELLQTRHSEISSELIVATQTLRWLIGQCRLMEQVLRKHDIPVPELIEDEVTVDCPKMEG